MPEVLAPLLALGTLTIFLWLVACASLIGVIMGYISGALSGLPYPVNKIAAPVASLASGIAHVCGRIEGGVDSLVGGAWHAFARYLDKSFSQLDAHAHVILQLAQLVGSSIYDVTGLARLTHTLAQVFHGIESGVKTLEKEYHGIEHRVKALEADVAHGIGADVLPRLRTLEREVGKVENSVLPAIEKENAALAHDVTTLGEWIRTNFVSVATDAAAAAVAVAIANLGLGGLRCNSLLKSLTNRGCGVWSGLEDLLGLFIDALILTDLCEILPETVKFFGYVEGALTGLISQAANAVCSLPNQKWTTVDVQAGPRPPAQTFDASTLASGG